MGYLFSKLTLLFLVVASSTVFSDTFTKNSSFCIDLNGLSFSHATVTNAQMVPAGSFQAPDGKVYELPAFCRIQGVARPSKRSNIKLEIWLPQKNDWNGRYYQFGQGGPGGLISYQGLAAYLKEGSVVASTDDGHTAGSKDPYKWALGEPEKIIDWGYRALKETTDVARVVIQKLYQQPASYRYFSGCSRGGQQALMAAQRYPEDWDGVLVGAPDIYLVQEFFSFMERGGRWKNNPKGRIPKSMLSKIQLAALDSCTSKAHVLEGITTNPEQCAFDPSILACTGETNDECLTSEQISTLQEVYEGAKNHESSELIHPGFPAAAMDASWENWMPVEGDKNEEIKNYAFLSGESFYRNVVFKNPHKQVEKWDFKSLSGTMINNMTLSEVLNADNPDLKDFKKGNGKIMMYFGWSDPAIPPASGIKYYNKVVEAMGGESATRSFFRLFMAPGMSHCVGGVGANSFDQLFDFTPPLKKDSSHSIVRALEAWVEEGEIPNKIIATKYLEDDPRKGVAFTRPLCPYPEQPILGLGGNPKEAANFKCQYP